MENSVLLFFFAVLGGGLPPLIWLFFWLSEDAHPEPRPMIVAAFLSGIVIVPLAVILEDWASSKTLLDVASQQYKVIENIFQFLGTPESLSILIALIPAVVIEEVLKMVAFLLIVTMNKDFDEPVDALIYLITAALGFAAFENILFFLGNTGTTDNVIVQNIFISAEVPKAFIINNLRFIGANLLHVVASGFVGVGFGLAFYKKGFERIAYIFLGLCGAILLHLLFNYFIIVFKENPLVVFEVLWIFAVVLIFLFERVKAVRQEVFYQNKLSKASS